MHVYSAEIYPMLGLRQGHVVVVKYTVLGYDVSLS